MKFITHEYKYLPNLFGPSHQAPQWNRYKVYYLHIFCWKISVWKTLI